ncbi:MAG: glycoside hydrolase family 65 protein [Cytophagaceae bacterium]|nr:glycoside hydrolase family 65 protein [Cytophagaceae bacterium]
MKNYIRHDEWKIIEEGFHAEYNEITESLMSLGNGRMGQRGNFEESFSGHSLQGNYVAGVWFPDKTRVGWWKNGYPDYFAKVINAANWVGIEVKIGEIVVDLAKSKIEHFYRELDMKTGVLSRDTTIETEGGKRIRIQSSRFCSMANDEAGVIKYQVTPLNFSGEITFKPFIDGDISNKDSNHGEKFWEEIDKETHFAEAYLTLQTKKSPWPSVPQFQVCTGMKFSVLKDDKEITFSSLPIKLEKYVACETKISATEGETITIFKYAVNLSSENHQVEKLAVNSKTYLEKITKIGYEDLLAAHVASWEEKWNRNDIIIKGDVSAQQGIRFNIFHLQQTYTGQDARLNIGPKGFTGEKYGGVTYWDTEAYCIPFYLSAADSSVARNLLVYRYNHLQKAIENAQKLGFKDGAALYPMVTMNGEECHNEWEITFEEIHRNGAIAYAIYDYINYTGDEKYLNEYGLEVLIGISRFWSQRITWSENLKKYVMLGVTGPNEYENNVNNNWYTNYLAVWTLKYTLESLQKVKAELTDFDRIANKISFKEETETSRWSHIIENMHFPYDESKEVYLQQDGFLDKELLTVDQITEHRPINQKWSWDRILRSCFIKQADVLQGLYFFEDDFDLDTHRRNFDFYEPMTVHESSLSPCVHTILATKLDKMDKANEMYLRTSRLDIDDYNNDTEDGLHITSMAGTWMSVVKGFGGMRVKNGEIFLDPKLPQQWEGLSFRVGIQKNLLEIKISQSEIEIVNLTGPDFLLNLKGEEVVSISGNTLKKPL